MSGYHIPPSGKTKVSVPAWNSNEMLWSRRAVPFPKISSERFRSSILKHPLRVSVCDPFHAELQVDGFSGPQEDTDALRKIAVFGNFQHGIAS